MSGTCKVCGRPLDDLGTCACVSSRVDVPGIWERGAVTCRRMAQNYKDLAQQAELAGRHMDAAGFWRMHGELLQAAAEVEARIAETYGDDECQDGSEEFEGEP